MVLRRRKKFIKYAETRVGIIIKISIDLKKKIAVVGSTFLTR